MNSSHSPTRQPSDLMHELAHRIRNHEPEKVSMSSEGVMLLKAYGGRAGWRATAARCACPYSTPRVARRRGRRAIRCE
ncbi:ImmA/IrrE family metallo-endopeptidase [Trinickia dinghuensis]|uniref:ImmA/IrrE family metallo-endopeptidase n=1 Tax=Trinickia dinghuensis TaxID=2291023 RepID=UPI003CCC6E27